MGENAKFMRVLEIKHGPAEKLFTCRCWVYSPTFPKPSSLSMMSHCFIFSNLKVPGLFVYLFIVCLHKLRD